MIPALIINLPHSHDRLAFQYRQLEALAIPVHRLNAVSAHDIDTGRYEMLANGWQRKLRITEVACFLSHRHAWEQVAHGHSPLLILEDDVLLSQATPALLAYLCDNPLQADLVNLETRGRKKLLGNSTHTLTKPYQAQRLYQDRTGAAAYVLYPSGAKKLLHAAKRRAPALADAFISSCYTLKAYQINPAAAIQMDQCAYYQLPFANPFPTTIGNQYHPKPAAGHPLKATAFKYRRILAQLTMAGRYLAVKHRAKRQYVPIVTTDFLLP